jgi:hypothetical protein
LPLSSILQQRARRIGDRRRGGQEYRRMVNVTTTSTASLFSTFIQVSYPQQQLPRLLPPLTLIILFISYLLPD